MVHSGGTRQVKSSKVCDGTTQEGAPRTRTGCSKSQGGAEGLVSTALHTIASQWHGVEPDLSPFALDPLFGSKMEIMETVPGTRPTPPPPRSPRPPSVVLSRVLTPIHGMFRPSVVCPVNKFTKTALSRTRSLSARRGTFLPTAHRRMDGQKREKTWVRKCNRTLSFHTPGNLPLGRQRHSQM